MLERVSNRRSAALMFRLIAASLMQRSSIMSDTAWESQLAQLAEVALGDDALSLADASCKACSSQKACGNEPDHSARPVTEACRLAGASCSRQKMQQSDCPTESSSFDEAIAEATRLIVLTLAVLDSPSPPRRRGLDRENPRWQMGLLGSQLSRDTSYSCS